MDLLKLECHLWAVDPEVKAAEAVVSQTSVRLETPTALMVYTAVKTVGDNLLEEDREEKEAEAAAKAVKAVKVKRLHLTLVEASSKQTPAPLL